MLMYLVCISSAAIMREIEWRGITYDVTGPWNVRLLKYRPYDLPMESGDISIK